MTRLLILGAVAYFAFGLWHANGEPLNWSKDPKVREWYTNAKLTEAAQERMGWVYCCDHADVVRTEFRVNGAGDEWYYLLPNGEWKQIPPDIIHPIGEHAPDGRPTLFVYQGQETCFFVGRSDT